MSAPDRLRFEVIASIAEHALWAPGARVAVAVSGGLDSVVLLDLLVRTRGAHRGVLEVITVDHGTRPGAAEDARFVEALGASLSLPVRVASLSLGAEASEAACRAARYAALDALDVDVVALAHHRDDQAETVLLNLLRGTGPGGLEGMARRRGRYVRPLLGLARSQLAAYAVHRGVSWRDDPTNATPRYLRNRLRAEVLPLLESLRPGATEALARSATLAGEQGALLDAILEADVEAAPGPDGWSTAWLAAAPRALARRALHRALAPLKSAHVDAILAAARRGGGRVRLDRRREVLVDGGRTRLCAPEPETG